MPAFWCLLRSVEAVSEAAMACFRERRRSGSITLVTLLVRGCSGQLSHRGPRNAGQFQQRRLDLC
jgi:hypothetical protein